MFQGKEGSEGCNSISSSESWVGIKSVALLRNNTLSTCLLASLSFHYTRQSARSPLAASDMSEFSSCTPYMIDAISEIRG